MNQMQIISNFLHPNQFKETQNIIFNQDFPWRFRHSMTPDGFSDGEDGVYFTYSFFNNYDSKSDLYAPLIIPILKQLNCRSPISVRSNLFLNKLFNKCKWHTDYDFESTTAILYLNSCNGGTEFKINNKIEFVKAEANKIVIFPTKVEHRACTSTDSNVRYIINFNYFS